MLLLLLLLMVLQERRPLVHRGHGLLVVLTAVQPHVLRDVRQPARLALLDGLAERLVVHLAVLDVAGLLVQRGGRRRVQERRDVVDGSVGRVALLEEVGRGDLGGWVERGAGGWEAGCGRGAG